MSLTRRSLLASGMAGAACLAGSGFLSAPAWAMTELEGGGRRIDIVSDGSLMLPLSFLYPDFEPGRHGKVLAEHGLPGDMLEPDCNLTLVRDGERIVLFDVGSGPNFMPGSGKVLEGLDQLGVDPDEITHVVFTHAHPDHLWGVMDEFDEPLFSNAEYRISRPEWEYWTDPGTVETIAEARKGHAAGARRLLTSLEQQMRLFDFGQEILPGIAAIDTSGHTPGHTAFEVRLGDESVLLIGDCVPNHHIAFAHPDWAFGGDQDREAGGATRKVLLDRLVADRMRFIGFHLPHPGLGRAERMGGGYRFVAE
ncbi:MAG: MBL fold metallo-hydrolase [Pseudomonadota bacterium]